MREADDTCTNQLASQLQVDANGTAFDDSKMKRKVAVRKSVKPGWTRSAEQKQSTNSVTEYTNDERVKVSWRVPMKKNIILSLMLIMICFMVCGIAPVSEAIETCPQCGGTEWKKGYVKIDDSRHSTYVCSKDNTPRSSYTESHYIYYYSNQNDSTHNGICICGKVMATGVTHTWSQYIQISNTQCQRRCTATSCGATQTVNHNFVDGICSYCGASNASKMVSGTPTSEVPLYYRLENTSTNAVTVTVELFGPKVFSSASNPARKISFTDSVPAGTIRYYFVYTRGSGSSRRISFGYKDSTETTGHTLAIIMQDYRDNGNNLGFQMNGNNTYNIAFGNEVEKWTATTATGSTISYEPAISGTTYLYTALNSNEKDYSYNGFNGKITSSHPAPTSLIAVSSHADASLPYGKVSLSYEMPHEHTWGDWTTATEAGCTTAGIQTRTCTICSQTETQSIGALGHLYSDAWTKDATNHWHVCTRSGCTAITTKEAHTWGDWTTTTAATCTTAGTQTRTCTKCSQAATQSIGALGHSYTVACPTCKGANAKCSRCSAIDPNHTCTIAVPTVTLKVGGNTYSGAWTNQNVVASLVAANATGYQYSRDGSNWYSDTLSMNGITGTLTFSANQNGTIYFRSVLTSSVVSSKTSGSTIKIDKAAPTITLSASSVISGTAVTITLGDTASGVNAWQVTTSSTVSASGWTSITATNSTTATYTPTSAGTYYIWVKDVAGNMKFTTLSVGQATPPTVTTTQISTNNINWEGWILQGDAYIDSEGNLICSSANSGAYKWFLVDGHRWTIELSHMVTTTGTKQGAYMNARYYTDTFATATAQNSYTNNGWAADSLTTGYKTSKWTGLEGYGPSVKYVRILVSNNASHTTVPVKYKPPKFSSELDENYVGVKLEATANSGSLSSLKYLWSKSTSGVTEAQITNVATSGQVVYPPYGAKGTYCLWVLAQNSNGGEVITKTDTYTIDNPEIELSLGTAGGGTRFVNAYIFNQENRLTNPSIRVANKGTTTSSSYSSGPVGSVESATSSFYGSKAFLLKKTGTNYQWHGIQSAHDFLGNLPANTYIVVSSNYKTTAAAGQTKFTSNWLYNSSWTSACSQTNISKQNQIYEDGVTHHTHDIIKTNAAITASTSIMGSGMPDWAYSNQVGSMTVDGIQWFVFSNFDDGISVKKYAYGDKDIVYFRDGGIAFTSNSFAANKNGTYTVYTKTDNGVERIKTVEVTGVDNAQPDVTITNNGSSASTDPSFATGLNGLKVYNNAANGKVSLTRVETKDAPNTSGHAMHIKTNGEAQPGHGGFTFEHVPTADKQYVIKLVARIPTGYTLNFSTNSIGAHTQKWMTPTAGTGDWETYLFYVKAGSSGTFSSTNYFYLTGGSTATESAPVEWDVAYANAYSTTAISWTNQNVTITGKAKDTEDGIVAYGFAYSSEESENVTAPTSWTTITATTSEVTATTTADKNGAYYFFAKDANGNISKTATYVERIDKAAPTITGLTISPESWTNGTVKILLSANDELSGIAGYGTSDWGNVVISTQITPIEAVSNLEVATRSYNRTNGVYVLVKDVAGNTAREFINVTNIDKTAPMISNGKTHTPQEYYDKASGGEKLRTGGYSSSPLNYKGGTTSIATVNDGTVNSSNVLKITHAANATTSGFIETNFIDVSKVYVRKIYANIPIGYTLNIVGNDINATVTKLGSFEGTGDWKEYAYVIVSKNTTTNTMNYGHAYISGSAPTSAFDWYVATDEFYDVTNVFNDVTVTYGSLKEPTIKIEAFDYQSGVSSIKVNNVALPLTDATNGKSTNYTISSEGIYTILATDALSQSTTLTKNAYTITYNGNGASDGNVVDQIKIEGADIPIRTNGYTKAGYTFGGWSTSPDGVVDFAEGDAYTLDENVTLYAKWRLSGPSSAILMTELRANAFDSKYILGNSKISQRRTNIATISIEDVIPSTLPSGAWDVSLEKDKTVYAWLTNNTTDTTKYDLHIAANGGISLSSGDYIFAYYDNCTKIKGIENLNTSNATSMFAMFSDTSKLTSVDLSGFDTSKVTDMQWMFDDCSSLTSLDVSSFDTSNVTNMYTMFYRCNGLTSLNFGEQFDTSKVTDMRYMFYGCSSLPSVNLGEKFDTSKVTTMVSMFANCTALTSIPVGLDLSNTAITSVDGFASVFSGCSSLTRAAVNSKYVGSKMFYGCNSLIKIVIASNVQGVYNESTGTPSGAFEYTGTGILATEVNSSSTVITLTNYGWATDKRAVTLLDITPPQINVQPRHVGNGVVYKISVTDDVAVTSLTINGNAVTLSNGAYDGEYTYSSTGILTIVARDAAENEKMYANAVTSIVYNVNGGISSISTMYKASGVNRYITSTTPLRENYKFVSWNTNVNGTGTSYLPGSVYSSNANLTLYAIWEATGEDNSYYDKIVIDTTAPTISDIYTVNDEYEVTINADIVDPNVTSEIEGIGVDEAATRYAITQTNTQPAENSSEWKTSNIVTTSFYGTGYVWILAKDALGNTRVASATTKIVIKNYKDSDNNYYSTLADAFSSAVTGTTITVLQNTTDSALATLTAKTMTLDLNGKTITKTNDEITIDSSAELTITDNTGTNGKIVSTESALSNLITNYGKLTVVKGTISAKGTCAIYSNSILTIGVLDGNVSTAIPTVQGGTYGLIASNGFSFYDGILKGTSTAYNGAIIETESEYDIVTETEGSYKIAYVAMLDRMAPVGTISLSGTYYIGNNESYVNTNTVTIALTAVDNITSQENIEVALINENDYDKTRPNNDITWQKFTTTKTWQSSSGDGRKRVYVIFKDEAGNQTVYFAE